MKYGVYKYIYKCTACAISGVGSSPSTEVVNIFRSAEQHVGPTLSLVYLINKNSIVLG